MKRRLNLAAFKRMLAHPHSREQRQPEIDPIRRPRIGVYPLFCRRSRVLHYVAWFHWASPKDEAFGHAPPYG